MAVRFHGAARPLDRGRGSGRGSFRMPALAAKLLARNSAITPVGQELKSRIATESRGLGARYLGKGRCEFVVWAPYAASLCLQLQRAGDETVPMVRGQDVRGQDVRGQDVRGHDVRRQDVR